MCEKAALSSRWGGGASWKREVLCAEALRVPGKAVQGVERQVLILAHLACGRPGWDLEKVRL